MLRPFATMGTGRMAQIIPEGGERMTLGSVHFGTLQVSRLIIGGNPFSGHSHQSVQKNQEMRQYYTVARIKQALSQAEEQGINTFCGRADRHIIRMLLEYWDEGGKIQWLAQTCPEYGSLGRSIDEAIKGGASAVYLHGGHMDNLLQQRQMDIVAPAIAQIHAAGLPAGIAGHMPAVFEWAEANVDVDFYMCSYHNPIDRSTNPEHVAGSAERFEPEDRDAMTATIAHLSKPAIHYKIFAAGRTDPREAFAYVARRLRPSDAVCFGVYTKEDPDMIAKDVALFQHALRSEPIAQAML